MRCGSALVIGMKAYSPDLYSEPLITSEWAVEVFKQARAHGLKCVYISNGNGTPEVLDYLRRWVDLYKVDLKCFDDTIIASSGA
jgi:pyruvate-formate lyase-activating enzyme